MNTPETTESESDSENVNGRMQRLVRLIYYPIAHAKYSWALRGTAWKCSYVIDGDSRVMKEWADRVIMAPNIDEADKMAEEWIRRSASIGGDCIYEVRKLSFWEILNSA